jgi:hypothetical protein
MIFQIFSYILLGKRGWVFLLDQVTKKMPFGLFVDIGASGAEKGGGKSWGT